MPESTSNISDKKLNLYNYLWNLSDVVIYTDYSPRNDQRGKYKGSDIPSITVDLKLMEDEGERSYQKNRRWKMKGLSIPDEFYSPDYSKTERTDFDYRRTLYWNPSLKPDADGKVSVEFYNSSNCKSLKFSAESISSDGTIGVLK
jgi:hypothetical protein